MPKKKLMLRGTLKTATKFTTQRGKAKKKIVFYSITKNQPWNRETPPGAQGKNSGHSFIRKPFAY
jgi:hypothetical protein